MTEERHRVESVFCTAERTELACIVDGFDRLVAAGYFRGVAVKNGRVN